MLTYTIRNRNLINRSIILRRRCCSSKKNNSSTSPPNNDNNYKEGMEKLKKTNPYLYKMAPTRGGTEIPDAKFLAIFAVISAAGFYAWFIDPPKKQQQEQDE